MLFAPHVTVHPVAVAGWNLLFSSLSGPFYKRELSCHWAHCQDFPPFLLSRGNIHRRVNSPGEDFACPLPPCLRLRWKNQALPPRCLPHRLGQERSSFQRHLTGLCQGWALGSGHLACRVEVGRLAFLCSSSTPSGGAFPRRKLFSSCVAFWDLIC